MLWPARIIGAVTAAYSVACVVKPEILAGPTQLVEPDGRASRGVAVLARGASARDLITGVAMAAAPTAAGVRMAGALRLGADVADAVGMGVALPTAQARNKAALVAGGWGALTALTLLLARKRQSSTSS